MKNLLIILLFPFALQAQVTLNGSASYDPDGFITKWQWRQIKGPSTIYISNPVQAITSVSNFVLGVYEFELTVTDDKGATDKDSVLVTVTPETINAIPVVDAGTDQATTATSVKLSGKATDYDGTITGVLWKQTKGVACKITSDKTLATNVTGLKVGQYEFKLTATDNKGAVASDLVLITVIKKK